MLKKIILVFKTHFDIGFTDLAENVIHGYGNEMLREVIETCSATEDLGRLRYVWTMPAWPLHHITRHCDPALKPELDRFIGNGQIVWHSLPFTTHTDFSTPDEYLQALRFSRELAEEYGKPIPISAKMTDVPGHGLMLPELLSQAGIRFLHLGCNEFATPPDVPGLFFWESPAGGRVLTMYSKGGYGTGLTPPKGWKYPVWMALMHTHDNCGPQSAELILSMAKKAQALYPDAEVVCGTMDDFCRELEQCDLSDVPVVREDLADTWIHGVGSYPREVSLVRESRERARVLHSRALARFTEGVPLAPELEELWKDYYESAALFSEHTWGADVKTWLGPDRVYEKEEFLEARNLERYRFMETSWAEQRTRAEQAAALLDRIEALLPEMPCEKTPESPAASAAELTVLEEAGALTVSGGRFSLRFDAADGRVLEVSENGQLLLKAGAEGIFSYRYDKYGLPDITEFLRSYGYHFTTWGIQDYGRESYPDCEHETFSPAFTGWSVEGCTLVLRYRGGESRELYGDCREVVLRLTLGQTLDAELQLLGKEASPYVESGSLVLPLAGESTYRMGKPGGVVDPESDIRRCSNHAMFNLEREITVLGNEGSFTVCPMDTPLVGIGTPGVYEYRPVYGEKRENVLYFNLFNNMWGTNFPQWMEGDYRYRFRIGTPAPETAPQWAAEQLRGSSLGIPQGMELVCAVPECGGLILGLRDLTGKAREAALQIPGVRLTPLDLFFRPAGSGTAEEARFPVRPWSVHLFRAERI